MRPSRRVVRIVPRRGLALVIVRALGACSARMSGVCVRERRPEDVPTLGAILAETRREDGYPPHWPAPGGFFVAAADELDSFVHDDAGRPTGHVALHVRSARSVMEVAVRASGLDINDLVVVARLFVEGSSRRTGAGRALLERATVRARELGRQPILDVWEGLSGARALYESAGWRLAGSATLEFRSGCTSECVHMGRSIDSLVYLGPPG